MFAKTPIQTLVNAAMAAVAVTKSRLISWMQRAYAGSLSHCGSAFVLGHTQVPPDCDVMLALT
jgi:hypothetical protein